VTSAIERVQTVRLVCARLRPEHLPELFRLACDPRVAAWNRADSRPPSERDVAGSLAVKVAHWERYGFGQWLLRDRLAREMVGQGGLQHTRVGGEDEVEVGYAIVPGRWGQGLATEMTQAALTVAFGELGLTDVVAFTLPHNVASRRVMEKAGFAFERDIEHAGLPHVLYRLRGDAWQPPSALVGLPPGPLLRSGPSAPLTRSREARKEHVARPDGRPRPR
jgi:ribosomal-protein-alanine N-acetyltransferase